MGTISNAVAYYGMRAEGSGHTRTNVSGVVSVGVANTTQRLTTADIGYSFEVIASGSGSNVATWNLVAGTGAQTTGTPTLVDSGKDFEGVDIVEAVSLCGIFVECDDNSSEVTVQLKDSSTVLNQVYSEDNDVKVPWTWASPISATNKTLVITLAGITSATLTSGSGSAGVVFTAASAGQAGNSITVVTANAPTSAVTSAAEVGTAITVTRGGKARMTITGTLTSDGSTSVTFPELPYSGEQSGKSAWGVADPSGFPVGFYGVSWNPSTSKWELIHEQGASEWHSSDDVATPDLVTTWVAQGSATGAPVAAASYSSAGQVTTATNAASALVTAANVTDGTDTFAAIGSATALSGGDGTAQPSVKVTVIAKSS